MQRQTRMWRTLIALAIAMSGTTGLLAWMDPSEWSPQVDSQILLQQAADLVSNGADASESPRWSRIDLVRGQDSSDVLLSASYDRSPAHVIVDRGGEIHRGSVLLSSRHASVRVRVDLADAEPVLTPTQWTAVRALATNMQRTDRPIDLHLDAELAAAYGVDPAQPLHLDPL